jgi:hypothetical protein
VVSIWKAMYMDGGRNSRTRCLRLELSYDIFLTVIHKKIDHALWNFSLSSLNRNNNRTFIISLLRRLNYSYDTLYKMTSTGD